jgi:hypothetical protein
MSTQQNKKGKWQFGLLTLLLLTAGVSCLASGFAVLRSDKQRNRFARQCLNIGFAIHRFHSRSGRIPTEEEGLDVLTSPNPWLGRPDLASEDLVDVWGNKVVYTVVDLKRKNGFTLCSFGPNGVGDGGRKDDIRLDDVYDVTSISRNRLQLVAFLCVGSYVFIAIAIAVEHQRRKAIANQ